MVSKLDLLLSSESFNKLYQKVIRTININSMSQMISKGVVLGLSGGADSVMLLHILLCIKRSRESFHITAVHVNHKIRGEEADRDEEFCRRLCKELDVEFISYTYDVPEIAKTSSLGLEECARNIRYSCFEDLISSRKDLNTIITAHNADDNLETVLLNILRGSGTKGGAGIPPVRNNIIRPLLSVSKKEIVDTLDEFNIDYVTDSTNLSIEYKRNYIRNEISPRILKICEHPEDMFTRFSSNLRCDEDYISSEADRFLYENEQITSKAIKALHRAVQIRVFSKLFNSTVSESLFEDIIALISAGNDFTYSIKKDVFLICEKGIISVLSYIPEKKDYILKLDSGINHFPEFSSDFIVSDKKIDDSYLNVYTFSIQQNLSSAIIYGSLFIRSRREGDSVFYGGMTHKVKKLFSDRKIPKNLRNQIPLLCDEKGIVWIPGFGVRDDGGKVLDAKGLFAALCIKDLKIIDRFYSASEFKT